MQIRREKPDKISYPRSTDPSQSRQARSWRSQGDVPWAQFEGVRHVALPDVLHGTFGGPWYGDGHVIDRWWPAALEQWQAALAAREAGATGE